MAIPQLPVTILLSQLELDVAVCVGRARDAYALKQGYRPRHGENVSQADNHILGVEAELAAARYLGQTWKPMVGRIDGVDIGTKVEVRGRRMTSRANLSSASPIARGTLDLGQRDRNKGDSMFVLAHRYANDPRGTIVLLGWAYGREVMTREHHEADPARKGGVCRLPHAKLRSMPSLIEKLREIEDEQREHGLRRWRDRWREHLPPGDGPGGRAQGGRVNDPDGHDRRSA